MQTYLAEAETYMRIVYESFSFLLLAYANKTVRSEFGRTPLVKYFRVTIQIQIFFIHVPRELCVNNLVGDGYLAKLTALLGVYRSLNKT